MFGAVKSSKGVVLHVRVLCAHDRLAAHFSLLVRGSLGDIVRMWTVGFVVCRSNGAHTKTTREAHERDECSGITLAAWRRDPS
jgi:hypothetical protein